MAEAILAEAQRLVREGVDEDYYKRIVNANFGAALKALNSFESIAVSMAEGRFQGTTPTGSRRYMTASRRRTCWRSCGRT